MYVTKASIEPLLLVLLFLLQLLMFVLRAILNG